ncbi:hypothetical protein WMF38_26375 [Sorangium sp. So ce118]
MKKRLESAEGGAAPITTLFLDADAVLDRTDVDLEDILVALWGLVYEMAPAAAARTLGAVWKSQIADVLGKLITNLPDKVPDAVNKLLGDVRLSGVEQKKLVRTALGSVTTPLIQGLNDAFAAIRSVPPNDPTGPLVVLIDNLEKLSEGQHPAGLAALAHLLEKRVRFDVLFEEGRAAAERIARYSGGCIRHALRLVLDAVNEHDTPRVTAASIERAAGGIQADFERALPEAYVSILKQVARDNRFPDSCDDQVKRELLRHLYVLEYQNGDPDPWWAVHPLVERCRKYREST